jgi:hypothetical protein
MLTPAWVIGGAILMVAGVTGCRRGGDVAGDAEWWRLETERIGLAHQIELCEVRLAKAEARGAGHAEQEAVAARAALACERLSEQAAALEGEIEALSGRLVTAREGWLRERREAAVGKSFAEFRGAGGRGYRDVVVTRVTEIGIEFRHATGVARLAAADLSADQRDAFGLEAASALAALADERQAAEAYGSWVDQRVAAAAASGEAMGPVEERAEARVADAGPRLRSSLRDQPRTFGSGSIWSFRGSRSRCFEVRPSYYQVVPVCRSPVPVPGGGFQNFRVPGASWSFATGSGCRPMPRSLPFTTTP